MTRMTFKVTLLITFMTQQICTAMIMRNNALMTKMVSNFQKDNSLSVESPPNNRRQTSVLATMQNVLCKNFPSIPCEMIVQDSKLKNLIEKSIQQIKYKKLSLDKTTPVPGYLTLFPVINSEDLSNFLQVSDTGYFNRKQNENHKKKQKKSIMAQNFWSHETMARKKNKNKQDTKKTTVYNGRKKLKKFYPHKIKYKDKGNNAKKDFGDYSEEKLSMSVEMPDMGTVRKRGHLNYKAEAADPPVWRIDYMKHGEPSLNMFGYDTGLKGKIMKTGPNVIVDENVLEQAARRDVLHPDVYIKKNFIRQNPEDSGIID